MNTRCIQRSILLDAAPAEVFDRLSNPSRLPEWFAEEAASKPADADGCPIIEIKWHRHGRVIPDLLHVSELKPFDGARARFVYKWDGAHPRFEAPLNAQTEVALDLLPDSGGTRLILNETGFGDGPAWDFALRRHSLGWDVYLESLVATTGAIPTRVITGARLLRCGAAEAWYALTKPEMIGRWIDEAEVWDVRPGGLWRMKARSAAIGSGRFTHVVPYAELAFSWSWYDAELGPTHVAFRLAETEDGAFLRVFHHGWGYGPLWDHELTDCKNGWNQCLKSLSKLMGDS